jgi:PAS domain S-box-containing protein
MSNSEQFQYQFAGETALRNTMERLEFALAATKLGVWDLNLLTGKAFCSNQCRQILGIPLDDLDVMEEKFLNNLHPEDCTSVVEAATKAIREKSTYNSEYRIIWQDGTVHWVAARANTIYGVDGQPLRMVGTVEDITARKQVEQTLQDREAQLHLALEAARMGTWDIDFLTQRGHCSHQLQGIFDVPAEYSYETWLNSIYWEDRDRINESVKSAIDNTADYCVEFRVARPHGGFYWIESRGRIERDASGKAVRMIGVAADITTRKVVEVEREELLVSEHLARIEAETANSIKEQFLAVLSHEIRSPLNPILGWTKLLKSSRLDANTTIRALDTIERNAQLQSRLIDDLLDVSRILRGKISLNFAVVDLESIIAGALETIELAAQTKNIQIEYIIEPHNQNLSNVSNFAVWGDGNRLQQIIGNLLSNAIKFTPSNGSIVVKLERINAQIQVTVSDTGKGITADFLPYIFDYFRQADTSTTRKSGGLGLGLAIVRQLVELHHGTVQAQSDGEDKGATFMVKLPFLRSSLISNDSNITITLANSPIPLAGVRILVVDDEPDTRDLLEMILENSGAIVTVASCATEVLTVLEKSHQDILLSDIGMPKMDGYELIRRVRNLPSSKNRNIPAIALTAYATDFDEQKVITAGFQLHIPKPVEPEYLVNMLVKLIN